MFALLTPSLPGDIAADATFKAPVFVIQRARHRQRRNPQVTYEALPADNGAWQVDGLLGLALPEAPGATPPTAPEPN